MGWLQRIFSRRRADPVQRFIWPDTESGVRLTSEEALKVSAVWACIDVIAKAIASCRWNVYAPLPGGRRELLEDDPISWVLNTRPNPEMTAIGFREAMLYIAIPFGNAYAEIVRNGAGGIAELWPLDPDRVTPVRDEAGALVYRYLQPDGIEDVLTQRQVLHIRGPSVSGLVGENIIARAVRTISSAAAADRFASQFFGKGVHAAGVLKHPKDLDEEKYNRLRKSWAEHQQGLANRGKPIILEEGMEYQAIGVDPKTAQMVESRQFAVEEICRWFGVPPHKVQHLLRATFSNIEHLSIEFVRDALTPWCRRLEQEADYKLFPQTRGPWRYTCIDTAPLSYGDAYSRAQAHAVWRQNGVMTANEIRSREGLNDAGPEGDVLLVQSNMTTVELLLNPPEPPAPASPPPAQDDEGDDEGDDEAADVAYQALFVMVSAALERYGRRLANQLDSLSRRHGPDAARGMLEAERRQVAGLFEADLTRAAAIAAKACGRPLVAQDAQRALAALEAGTTPALAAEQMLSAARSTARPMLSAG